MKRTISILAGFAFFLLANTARAEPVEVDSGMYWSVRGGVAFFEHEISLNWAAIPDDPLTIPDESVVASSEQRFLDMDPGWMAGVAVGYTLAYPRYIGDVRVELEAAYRRYDGGQTNSEWSAWGDVPSDIEETVTISSAMFNVYADIPTHTRFVPFIGVGIGYSRVKVDVRIFDATASRYGVPFPDVIEEQVDSLSWQAMVGVGYNLSSGTVISVEYRSFSLSGSNYLWFLRSNTMEDIILDDWLLSLRYTF
jgi:opacity protein-like surface antigen